MDQTIEIINYTKANPHHQKVLIELVNHYISDEMGGGEALNAQQEQNLIYEINSHPKVVILIAKIKEEYAGMALGFINISTFKASKTINIHDLIVKKTFRRQGCATELMRAMILKSQSLGCSKLTLEVRSDNLIAQQIYQKLGFGPTHDQMMFWVKHL